MNKVSDNNKVGSISNNTDLIKIVGEQKLDTPTTMGIDSSSYFQSAISTFFFRFEQK
jgi:hypothetical protein